MSVCSYCHVEMDLCVIGVKNIPVWVCPKCERRSLKMPREEATPRREAYARRRLSMDVKGAPRGRRKVGVPPGPGARIGSVVAVDVAGATRTTHKRMATISSNSGVFYNPVVRIGQAISDALDPVKAPSRGRSFADMTPEEREEMRKRYEKKA
jgi:hypothetical protein